MTKLIFAILAVLCSYVSAQTYTIEELQKSGVKLGPDAFTEPENECRDRMCTYHVRGTITAQTVQDVQRYSEKRPDRFSLQVQFDSLGGDVHAAIELGRLIRKHGGWTIVSTGKCASACVLSFVGGVYRHTGATWPQLGIHTPYSISTRQTSPGASQKRYQELGDSIRTYLRDMNIPDGLYDEMLRYPAEAVHYLTKDEVSRYRLTGTDPAQQDQDDSAHARRLGVDKVTYLARKAQVKRECDRYWGDYALKYGSLQFFQCQERILQAKNP